MGKSINDIKPVNFETTGYPCDMNGNCARSDAEAAMLNNRANMEEHSNLIGGSGKHTVHQFAGEDNNSANKSITKLTELKMQTEADALYDSDVKLIIVQIFL